MPKIAEIEGVLPVPYAPDNDQNFLSDDEIGYNKGIDEIGQTELSIVFDREKLATLLKQSFDRYASWNRDNVNWIGLSDAIISATGIVSIKKVGKCQEK